jgi:molybdate transport repressor ModE-like protein
VYDITLHRLRIFKCVVESGGIRAAASALGISQPSVSAHVRGLEAMVGQPLLDRRPGKSGSLTDAGHLLYSYAHDVVVGADSVSALLRELSVGRRGNVSLAATRTLGNSLLGPILTEFHRASPGVLISIQTGRLSEVAKLVLTGEVGFGIVVSSGPIPGLESELLRKEPVLVLAGPSNRLARMARVEPSALQSEPLFVSLRSSSNFRSTMAALRLTGFSFSQVALETDDYAMLKSVIAEGSGIAVLPEVAVTKELARGELVRLPLSFPVPELELRLAFLPRHRFTPSEATLAQLMRDRLSSACSQEASPLAPSVSDEDA